MLNETTARAYRAYFSTAKKDGLYSPPAPNTSTSGVQMEGGKQYVVLRNDNGILAVYRVRNDGMLKRMKRWPKGLDEY